MKLVAILAFAGLALGLISGLPFREAKPGASASPVAEESNRSGDPGRGDKPEGETATDPLHQLLAAAGRPQEIADRFEKLLRDTLRDPHADTALLALCASMWAKSDPEAMLAYLLKENLLQLPLTPRPGMPNPVALRSPHGLDLSDLLFSNWTESDPRTAAEAAAKLADHPTRANGIGLHKVFWKAFEMDPQTARSLVTEHPEMLLALGFDDRSPTSPPIGVYELLSSLPESTMRTHALGRLPFGLQSSDEEVGALWDWFHQQEASVQRDALPSLFTAQRRFELSQEQLENLREISTGQEPLARYLVSRHGLALAETDPSGTESWIRENFAGQQEFQLLREFHRHERQLEKQRNVTGDK